jgi:hypothetical protein
MDPNVVLIITWTLAGLVVAAYIWFVVWRFRVDRRKKEAQEATDAAMSDAIAKTAAQIADGPKSDSRTELATRTTAPARPSAPVAAPAPVATGPADVPGPHSTVASCLSGIALPHDLVPLTTVAARPSVGDRVAFWTDRAPADVVGPAFASELERLGFAINALDEQTLSAQRGPDRLLVVIHPDGSKATIGDQPAFSSVPDYAVVIETWLPL